MSNRGEPWRKFVQTFFLAEQPNGYFVLNDIFRFLKEETVDSDEDREEGIPAQDEDPTSSPGQPVVPIFDAPPEPEPVEESVSAPSPIPPVEEPTFIPEPSPEPQTNGLHTPAPEEPEAEPEPVAAEPSPAPVPAATLAPEAPSPAPRTASPAVSTSATPSAPSPAPSSQPPPQSQPAAPAQPAAPKTWANLAAANSKKWGSAVAQESRGVTEVPVTNTPPNGPQSPAPHGAPGLAHRDPHPAYIAAQSITTPQCFVKVFTIVILTYFILTILCRVYLRTCKRLLSER